jgi:hypothetical protein
MKIEGTITLAYSRAGNIEITRLKRDLSSGIFMLLKLRCRV